MHHAKGAGVSYVGFWMEEVNTVWHLSKL